MAGPALLRIPARPVDSVTELLAACPADDPRWVRTHRRLLAESLRDADVVAAVRQAAPELARALEAPDALEQPRVALALDRYLNRMGTRATPFGLLAGVAGATFAPGPAPVWEGRLRPRVAPDASWQAEAPEPRTAPDEALVAAASLAHTLDGHLWLEPRGDERPRWLRRSAPVDVLLAAVADGPTTIGALLALLTRTYPSADPRQARRLLSHLLRLGFLRALPAPPPVPAACSAPPASTASLALPTPVGPAGSQPASASAAPPVPAASPAPQAVMASPGPAGSSPASASSASLASAELRASATGRAGRGDGASGGAGVTDARDGAGWSGGSGAFGGAGAPDEVLALCQGFNRAPDPAALAELEALAGRYRPEGARSGTVANLRVDAVAPLRRATVDPAVAALAETAASVLALVGRGSRYPAELAHAAGVFARHFGASARIPALEAAHTLTALRALGNRRGPLPGGGADPARETLLAGLVATALAERRTVCELDDALIARLSTPGDPRPALPGVDVCLRVGRDPDDPDAPWQAVVSGPGAVPTGVAYGRFTHLLDAATRRALRASVRAEEAAAPGFAFAELSYRPQPGRAGNVTARDLWRTRQLAVDLSAVVHPGGALDLADVLVRVEDGRFALDSARLGRPLHLTQTHGLALHLAPPVCRFLLDVSANQFRHPAPFDWGRAATGPFLPRLARGELVLAPARWRLTSPAPGMELAHHVRDWARTWMVPRHVRLVERSGHVLLDLESGVSSAQLRAALLRSGDDGAVLEEALPLPGHEVVTDARGRRYAAEVVVPVIASPIGPRETAAAPGRAPAPVRRAYWPGDTWFGLHLGLDAGLHDALITGPLRQLHDDLGPGALFFVRYADPGDELRLRVRQGRRTADQLTAWARDVARALPVRDIAVRTYRPETDRYGGPAAVPLAERLFCADSAAVIGLLAQPAPAPGQGLARPLLTALTLDRLAALLLPDLDARRELAAALGPSEAGSGDYRAQKEALWTARTAPGPVLRSLQGAADLWAPDAAAYRDVLGRMCAGLPEAAAVLHLHANRMGLSRAQETAALGVWRRLLAREAHTARTTGATGVLPTREVASS